MSRNAIVPLLVMALAAPLVSAAAAPATAPARMTAEAIVARNIAARGGENAWHAIQTLSWSGKMEAGGNNQRHLKVPGQPAPPANPEPAAQVQLPFTLDMKRGHKMRLDLQFNGQTAVQVYDGAQGWKLRPFLNRHQVESYTAEEARIAADEPDFGGLLVDYAAKGTRIDLEGTEAIDGKTAYKLKLTLKSGRVLRDWVDTQSFLEVKVEGTPRRLDGRLHSVATLLRDYRNVGGVQIPYLIETKVQGVDRTEKIVIEKATVNPRLEDSRFAKPV